MKFFVQKEAETHLPELEARDGISITMEDIGTSRVWNMRYRYSEFHWQIFCFVFWLLPLWYVETKMFLFWTNFFLEHQILAEQQKQNVFAREHWWASLLWIWLPIIMTFRFSITFIFKEHGFHAHIHISLCRWLCESQWTPRGRFHSDILRCEVWQICMSLFLFSTPFVPI